MALRCALARMIVVVVVVGATMSLPGFTALPNAALAAQLQKVALSTLTAQGFEIKAVSGNQAGVIGTLVLQKQKDVFMCESKDLSVEPIAFDCWPVK
jgi:hypothetical protein